jgi:exodeoxyribonuclease III
MEYKLACWNVNGIRACERKGLLKWLENEHPHIIGFQEIKANITQLGPDLCEPTDYYSYFVSAKRPGYSGVGLFSSKKLPQPNITEGLGIKKFDDEGRTIIAEYPDFFLINAYFPNGQPDLGRVPFKLEYSRLLAKKALALKKKKPVIICGDVNTAHEEIDIARPKENEKTTGFLPIERAWVSEFISQGFIDIFRHLHPNLKGAYTWWSVRTNARPRNVGWRLDYFFITPSLLPKVKSASILNEIHGSDHCPILLKITF